jgi:hypothetical protein
VLILNFTLANYIHMGSDYIPAKWVLLASHIRGPAKLKCPEKKIGQ